MKKILLCMASIAALCACTKAEMPEVVSDSPDTKSATEYLDITIRLSSFSDRGGGSVVEVNPLPDVTHLINLDGWIRFTQAWAKAEVPGQLTTPIINKISFTVKNVYYVEGDGTLGSTGDFNVSIDFPRREGAYSEQMPFMPTQDSYIDINSLTIDPVYLKNDYIVRWFCDNLEIKTPPSYPYPDPDPDPDPDPGFDSLLLHSPRL